MYGRATENGFYLMGVAPGSHEHFALSVLLVSPQLHLHHCQHLLPQHHQRQLQVQHCQQPLPFMSKVLLFHIKFHLQYYWITLTKLEKLKFWKRWNLKKHLQQLQLCLIHIRHFTIPLNILNRYVHTIY